MYKDNSGAWWAVSPLDGSWLKWTGGEWVHGYAKVRQEAGIPTPDTVPERDEGEEPGKQWRHDIPLNRSGDEPTDGPVTLPAPHKKRHHTSLIADHLRGDNRLTSAPATLAQKFAQDWPGALCLCLGLIAWLKYPYICGIFAVLLGGYSLQATWTDGEKSATIPIAGIVLALAAMLAASLL
ncbi:MAG: hypothetical protein A4E35_02220 [Methanoregula sp. PtaU1.Bin051]|nr:MAG: hypothetical protein A4E35_02220 [Methanoregula sp. PtaU1.Bin051]